MLALQTLRSRILPPLSANVITVGIIRGGERNNIIPAEVYLEGTIRTFDTAIQDTLEERMRDIFDGTTKAAHATFELSFDPSPPVDDERSPRSPSAWSPSLQRVVGKENVGVTPPETGSEDFSFFSNIVPGFYFRVGVVPEGKASGGHHTPTFYADDKAVPIGIRALSTLVLDYLASGKR